MRKKATATIAATIPAMRAPHQATIAAISEVHTIAIHRPAGRNFAYGRESSAEKSGGTRPSTVWLESVGRGGTGCPRRLNRGANREFPAGGWRGEVNLGDPIA